MTDGTTTGSPAASDIAVSDELGLLIEGDGAPAPVVADVVVGKPVDGQDGKAVHADESKPDDGAAKPADTSTDAAKVSKRDRIQQLIREKRAEEAITQAALRQNQVLHAKLAQLQQPGANEAPEQFMARQISAGVTAERASIVNDEYQRSQSRLVELAKQAWAERAADARAKHADFDAKVHHPDLLISPVMADALREDDNGGEVAYWLGGNPDDCAFISSLLPSEQKEHIARLSAKVAGAAKPAKAASVAVTKAPPPVVTVSGGSGSVNKSLSDASFEEYRKLRGYK